MSPLHEKWRPRGPRLPPKQQLVMRAYGHALRDDYFKAMPVFEELIENGDPPPEILSSYATCLMHVGRMDEAAIHYRKARDLKPNNPLYLDNLIFCIDHGTDTTPEKGLEVRREWWECFGKQIAKDYSKPHDNDRDPERPLRVGYVSGDFKSHSASFAYHMVLMRHSPAVQAYCYFTAPSAAWDEWTSIYSQETIFRHVHGQDAPTIGDFIRRDKIDILVDLSGYSNMGRLDIFALKPAPIQIHAWGYLMGSGCDSVDYIFGDPIAMPHSHQQFYAEKIIHLPCAIPYVGPPYGPEVGPMPVKSGEQFTFGIFSRPPKVNPSTMRLWGNVLREVPKSRVLVKIPMTEHVEFRKQILKGLGIEPHRVVFEGYSDHGKHLEAWKKVDLALDPYPAAGGVTFAEALWQGVAHVTKMGDRIVNRLGPSIYSVVDPGLRDFVVKDDGTYIQTAKRWATEGVEVLAEWRARLRGLMIHSPLAKGYVEAVEDIYRDVWKEWCARK